MEEEQKDLVWLPASLAKKVKDNQDKKLEEKIILEYLDESRLDVKRNLETLDEDLIQYRGMMIKAKKEFEKAKNEQLKDSYELWEKFDKEMPKLSKKIDETTKAIEPLTNTVEHLNELLDKVRSYQLKDLLEIIREIESSLSNDGNTGKILKFLVKEYKSS